MQKFLDHAKGEVTCLHFGASSPVIEPYSYWTSPTWNTLVITENTETVEYLADSAANVQVCDSRILVKTIDADTLFDEEKLLKLFDLDIRKINCVVIDVRNESVIVPHISKIGVYPDLILVYHPAMIAEWHVTYDALQSNIPLDYDCNYYGPTITAYVHRAV